MRIMQLISGQGVNGAVLQCQALVRALCARGHEVTLVCRPESWTSHQFDNFPAVRLETNRLRRWSVADLRRVSGWVRDRQIDVLHTHQSRAHVFGLLLRWWTRTPCVATAHSRHWQPHWRWNDHVIANSDATYRYHRHWNLVPAKRMQVVHYLLDVHEFMEPSLDTAGDLRRQWGVAPDELLAGIIGDVIPRKGHWYAIQAWAEVARQVPASRLVVVGNEKHPRYTRQVKAEAQRLGIADRIIWAGYCNDIPAVMRAIDLCVSAAIEEALGLTVLEAMAAARAVVATDVGGVPENVLPGETGLLVPPGSPSQLAAAMIRFLSDGGYRRACGLAGQMMVRAKFNPEDQLRQTEAIYASLVAARREGPARSRRASPLNCPEEGQT